MVHFKLFLSTELDIDNSKIRIKKPFVLFQQYDFDITYDKTNNQFLIQTPISMFYSNIMKDSKSITMDITTSEIKFLNSLQHINISIKDRIERYVPSIIKNKTFVSPLRSQILRLKNKDKNSIIAFDENNEYINIDDITRNDKIIIIFQVEKVIVYSEWYSIYYKIIQIKRCNVIFPKENLFISKKLEDESKEHTIPEKYQKMLNMGIPRPAVEQRMKMDGYNFNINTNVVSLKDKPREEQLNLEKINIPEKYQKMLNMGIPKPAVEQRMKMDGIKNSVLSLNTIQSISLKKIDTSLLERKDIKGINMSRNVPSLEEITNALKRLRPKN